MVREAGSLVDSALNGSDELQMALIDAYLNDGQCKALEESCTLQDRNMIGLDESTCKVQTECRTSMCGSGSDMAIARHSTDSRKYGLSATPLRYD